LGVDSLFDATLPSPVPGVEEPEAAPSLPVFEDSWLGELVGVELDERESFR
jgi:hypothetical protein